MRWSSLWLYHCYRLRENLLRRCLETLLTPWAKLSVRLCWTVCMKIQARLSSSQQSSRGVDLSLTFYVELVAPLIFRSGQALLRPLSSEKLIALLFDFGHFPFCSLSCFATRLTISFARIWTLLGILESRGRPARATRPPQLQQTARR